MNIARIVRTVLRLPFKLIPHNACLRVLRGPLCGKKWIVGSAIHRCWLGFYEYKKQEAFSAVLKRGDIVYDLGANVGFYSLLASAAVGAEGRVFSFEPVPKNLEFLRRHLELNNVQNCTVLNVAVSCSEGTAGFDQGPNRSMGHLASQLQQDTLRVRTIVLDDLIASGQLPPPNVIKCDIEGSEYDALMGATKALKAYGPTIFLATHGLDVHQRCCMLLAGLQYQLKPLDGLSLKQASEILAVRPNVL